MRMKIENEYILRNILNNGINIFAGAGFSTLAKHNKVRLPTGADLLKEIKSKFPTINMFENLSEVSEILDNESPEEYQSFLRERMAVTEFDNKYLNLLNINIKSIITTNIDDLFYKIFEKSEQYINDLTRYGRSFNDDEIPYIPLHGSVRSDRKLIFSKSDIVNASRNNTLPFSAATSFMSNYPILFLGYGMNDSDVEMIISIVKEHKSPEDIWILTNDTAKETYYRRMRYKTINGDIGSFLDWIGANFEKLQNQPNRINIPTEFKGAIVPKLADIKEVVPIEDFYQKGITNWYSVLNKDAFERDFITKIYNDILKGGEIHNLVLLGSTFSGKTTLLMILASKDYGKRIKYLFNTINAEVAKLFLRRIGSKPSIIFIDNMMNDIDAITILSTCHSLQIVGTSDDYLYEIIKYRATCFKVMKIPEISDSEKNQIRSSIPRHLRKNLVGKGSDNGVYKKSLTSFLEFNTENIKDSLTETKLSSFYYNIKAKDIKLFRLLAISTYLEYNYSILSTDILCLYFGTNKYIDLINAAKSYLVDIIPNFLKQSDQSYFSLRSRTFLHLSNSILKKDFAHDYGISIKKLFEISPINFPNLDQFQRRAFDANFFFKIFRSEAIEIYDILEARSFDRSAHILQQKALCSLKLGNTTEAFAYIEKALRLAPRNQSIRNSQAVILFEANKQSTTEVSIEQMRKAMEMLQKCYKLDTRKKYHVLRYAEFSLFLEKNHGIRDYNALAYKWLIEEQNTITPDSRIDKLLEDLRHR